MFAVSGSMEIVSFLLTALMPIIVQKAGTSALGYLLDMHPMLKNAKSEVHFFDENSFLLENLHNLDDEITICKLQRRYHIQSYDPLNKSDHGKVFFEKTPRYMMLPDVPRLIKKVCPWKPKIIAILRNPIDRLQSHHKMNVERGRGTHEISLDQAINAELQVMRKMGLTNAPLLTEQALHNDDAAFEIPGMSLLDREQMTRQLFGDNAKRTEYWLMQRGMYAVQLESWLKYYRLGISLHVIHYERLRSEPQQVWKEVLEFLQVPHHELQKDDFETNYSPNKGEYKQVLSKSTIEYLKKFYKPYNDRLTDLLGEEWRGVWD